MEEFPANDALKYPDLDREYENLLKTEDENLEKAHQHRKSLDEDDIRRLRFLAKNDLFFLSHAILGYTRLSPNLHGNLIQWKEKNKKWKYTEILMPRSTFKSTIITVSGTVQDVLPCDDELIIPTLSIPSQLGPDGRHLIIHEIDKKAQGYLYEITSHFMSNELLMALFPECIPSSKKHRINASTLEIPNKSHWKEGTVNAMGISSSSQGMHVDKLMFDDIIGKKARDSETEMQAARDFVDNCQAYFVRLALGVLEIVGTRYGPDDVYEHIEERYGEQLKIYRRSMEEADPKDLDEKGNARKKSIFPEEIGLEDLEILKRNPIVYAAQYMNEPGGGNTKFDPEWIRYYHFSPKEDLIHFEKTEIHLKKIVHISDLNICILWDPAVSGNTGYNVVGTDYAKRHVVLEAVQGVFSAPEAVNKFFELYAKYRFRVLGIEEVLFSELYRHWLESEFKLRGTRFNIYPITDPKKDSKEARVLGFSPLLAGGQVYLDKEGKRYSKNQDRTGKFTDLEYQIRKFGNIKEYHILDALANIQEVAMPGYSQQYMEQIREAEKEKLANRSSFGYSKISYKRG